MQQSRAAAATGHAFATSVWPALWYDVAMYPIVLVLLFRLPKVNHWPLAELDHGARTAPGG